MLSDRALCLARQYRERVGSYSDFDPDLFAPGVAPLVLACERLVELEALAASLLADAGLPDDHPLAGDARRLCVGGSHAV